MILELPKFFMRGVKVSDKTKNSSSSRPVPFSPVMDWAAPISELIARNSNTFRVISQTGVALHEVEPTTARRRL